MAKESKEQAAVQPKKAKEEKAKSTVVAAPEPAAKKEVPQIVAKKKKERRVLKKIEDFNKFHKVRSVKEALFKKGLKETIVLDPTLVLKAVNALLKFKKQKKEKSTFLLEEEDEFLYLEITLSKLPESYSIRPIQM